MANANPQRLDGKVAIITGAAGGIGSATARLFASLGAKVMLTDREGGDLEDLRGQLAEASAFAADCADEAAVQRLVAITLERFGSLDIMIANAGIEGHLGPGDQLSMEEFERVLRVNVLGVWLAIKYAAAPMKAAGGGAMVATSSIAGIVGFPGAAPYVASKHAVWGLVQTFAMELATSNIRINGVAPGPIDNRMMQSLVDQLGGSDPGVLRASISSRIPMKRYGRNEEIAHLIAFLASDAASYCNGSLYVADGGYLAG